MSKKLKTMLEFCVKHEMLDAKSAERIACENDRYWSHELDVVIKGGVEEKRLYEVVAKVCRLQLVSIDQLVVDPSIFNQVSLKNALQLSCIPYAVNASVLSVVICDWELLEVVAPSMANLTGKEIQVELISFSDFQSLRERFGG